MHCSMIMHCDVYYTVKLIPLVEYLLYALVLFFQISMLNPYLFSNMTLLFDEQLIFFFNSTSKWIIDI